MSHHVSKSLLKSVSGMIMTVGFCVTSLSVTASATDYTVNLNKTRILHLPAAASAVVVGNPDIADISVHSSDTVFIIGRGYGVTNLIALDEFGQTILDANITVQPGMAASGIRLIKVGEGQESYNCTPSCAPAPTLGDSPQFQSNFNANASPINNSQASAGGASSGGIGGQVSTALSAFPGQPGQPQPMAPGAFAGSPSGPPMIEN